MENFAPPLVAQAMAQASALTWADVALPLNQLINIAVVLVAAAILSRFLKRRLKKPTKASKLTPQITYSLRPLVFPLTGFLLLHFMFFIQMHVREATPLFYDETHKLVIAWVLIRLVMMFTNKKEAGWLVAGLILPITFLHIFGLWAGFESFLNDLGFTVGSFHVSVYKVGQGVLLVGFLFWAVTRLNKVVDNTLKRSKKLSIANRAIVSKIAQIGLYVFAFLITLDVLGIDLTALAVFGGAVGVGLGFGLQKITSNFISGLILLFEKSIKSGDMVEMSDGTLGTIRNISARHTLVETFSGKEIMVPNEDFITQRVINWTYSNSAGRIDFVIGVSYTSDIKKAKELILEAMNKHPDVSKTETPACNLKEFADSSVNFQVFFWVDDIVKGRFRPLNDVLFAIWDKFHENGIEIPFPQRDLHIKGPVRIETATKKQ